MGYTLLPGTRAPVRVWTDPYEIEPDAAQQLRNIGRPAVGRTTSPSCPTCTSARARPSAR